jgi:hypothetical protein
MNTMRLKISLVTVLSCLALLLGLLGSTGIASAHTAQSAQVAPSQTTSVSQDRHCHLIIVRVIEFRHDYFGFIHEVIRYRPVFVCHHRFDNSFDTNGYDGSFLDTNG